MPSCMINGREMHYLDQGEGFPLLMGHSYLWDSRMWAPQIELLSQHFRCIVPDLWSHGQSQSIAEGDLSIASLAEDYHLLMQHLGLARYSVLGMAVGGQWGAQLALKYPDEVASLVLLASSLNAEQEDIADDYLALLNVVKQMQEIPPAVIDAVAKIFFSEDAAERHPALVETFRFDLMFLTPEQVAGIVALGEHIFRRPSLLEDVGNIKCPTLILAGDKDYARPVSESEAIYDQISGSQFAIIENAGHMITLEQPNQINQILANFLSSIDGVRLETNELAFV